jgi:glucosamine-6-phosphate deaminase
MLTSASSGLMTCSEPELRSRARIPYLIVPDRNAIMDHFARSLADLIRARNQQGEPTRLILPVGPVAHYPILIAICNRERISWRNVHIFNMDEFLDWQGRPIPVDHPLSFEGFMRRTFARLDDDLGIPAAQIRFPHPFRIDQVSQDIASLGGIDCCYGGIGYHGHVAFNEPQISPWRKVTVEEMRSSLTRVLTLNADSIIVQSIHCAGGDCAAVPPMAVTLGMRDILGARSIRLYCAAGERHRAVFRISVAGEVTADYPSTLVQGHPDALVITDAGTAAPIEVSLG